MRREGGLWATAAVLGIAATVGISKPQAKLADPASALRSAGSAESSSPATSTAMQSIDQGPCADLMARLQSFLLVNESEIVAPVSCSSPRPQPATPSDDFQGRVKQLKFVIATLPDPLHTHLSLVFDRSAEAIRPASLEVISGSS